MTYDQSEFDIRCEWGEMAVEVLAPVSDAVIIVDIMSFSTAVTIAVARGAVVFPYRWKDNSRVEYAKTKGAVLAGPRGKAQYSLSPLSLMALPIGARIVLPSPNGSTLSLSTGEIPTFAGCLRNAKTVARAAQARGPRISVIACGERWHDDQSLRPAYEDLLGAGAIISFLEGRRSPEADGALAVYEKSKSDIFHMLTWCSSGRELIEMGFGEDIQSIAALNCEDVAPILRQGAYVEAEQHFEEGPGKSGLI
ncbi:MAG: hypothetical protein FP816_03465 [Desulfobacteraceae bacterium]|nr:hypothetical protein [Desulfobacteraceae bacterium]